MPRYSNPGQFGGSTSRGMRLIGERIKRRRERARLSQRQLEAISGVDQTTISRMENGRLFGMRWTRFARLVDALGGLDDADPLPPLGRRFLPPGELDIPKPEQTHD
jgi:transcriptional regulator with XRE-family HTH domain